MTTSRFREVLRGMEVERAPFRLCRGMPIDPEATGPVAIVDVEGEERSRGYEEGLALGRADGFRTGHAEGWIAGNEEAASRQKEAVAKALEQAAADGLEAQSRLMKIATSLEKSLAGALEIAEDEVVGLCFDTLCRVVGATAVQSCANQQVKEVLSGAARLHDVVAFRMHPDDVQWMESGDTTARGIACVPDGDIELGGCIAVGRRGSLDLRLETMLSGLKTALLQARAARRAGGTA